MILRIIEECWGIDRKTGEKSSKKTDEKIVEAVSGIQIKMSIGRRLFQIDQVSEQSICVSVIYENNPIASRTFEIEKGERMIYRPRSIDGGYKYYLSYENS